MDSSGLGGGYLSGPNGGLLDLESPMHQHTQAHLGHASMNPQPHMNLIAGLENDSLPMGLMDVKGGSGQQGMSANLNKGKAPVGLVSNSNMSEDDDMSFDEWNGENPSGLKGKKGTPWQRMKWTDEVVRLLIAVVACVGDDGAFECGDGLKRKSGIFQKKGKWKTVSKIMISKGCHVSPQQCEDKFNDLNKRYKKLNEILGRGTSCRVVEKPSLMESMPHLSAKAKDDVRKILSSKHLFYKEMCAYHNGQKIPNCQDFDLQGDSLQHERCMRENDASDEDAEDHDDEENDDQDDEDDDDVEIDGSRRKEYNEGRKGSDDDSPLWPQGCGFEVEMAGIFQDPSKSVWERKEWIKRKAAQLQHQKLRIQFDAFKLEKQRFKWLRYCSKKNREMERLRLENERMTLENERRELQLKQKELEMNFYRQEASLDPPPSQHTIERHQGRDQIDLDRHQ